MGILFDIVFLSIIILSAFLGYKKGLVKLGANLFAGILSIIIILIIQKPVTNFIIETTNFDEKIENAIIQNTNDYISKKTSVSETVTSEMTSKLLPGEARNIAVKVVNILTIIVLFVFIKLVLRIIISLLDTIAKLPILKQFNEVGGIVYGGARGIIISCIIVFLAGIYIQMNPETNLKKDMDDSYICQMIYTNLARFK